MSYIKTIRDQASRAGVINRTKASTKWFIDKLSNIRSVNRTQLLKDDQVVQRDKPYPGRMFMFYYDPKGKETLPYYDRFPLIIMVGPAEGGFYGLNLHYLDPRARAIFFDKLLEITTNKKYDSTTKFKISYSFLASAAKYRAFAPCFKHYLLDHIRSKVAEVEAPEWEIALFLPTDSFVRKQREQVWSISKAQLK
jgi:hypothetical protein